MTDHITNPAIRLACAFDRLANQVRENPELFQQFTVARAQQESKSVLVIAVGQELPPQFLEEIAQIALAGPAGLSQVINVDVSQPSG